MCLLRPVWDRHSTLEDLDEGTMMVVVLNEQRHIMGLGYFACHDTDEDDEAVTAVKYLLRHSVENLTTTYHLGELLGRLCHSFSVVAVHYEDEALDGKETPRLEYFYHPLVEFTALAIIIH